MPGTRLTHTQDDDQEALAVAGLFVYRSGLRNLLNSSLDLLFPPRCAGCGRVDYDWCGRCEKELSQTPLDVSCKALTGINVLSTGLHEGKLQQAIHALKYENLPRLADLLGQRLVEGVRDQKWSFDMIVPVPLHPERFAARGYNQSELLGDAIAAGMGVPCVPDALVRLRQTPSQVGLNRDERMLNVAEAFAADTGLVSGRALLLVDDVCTTGATLVACTQAARLAGARAVLGVTLTTPHPVI